MPKTRVLIIEDQPKIAGWLARFLEDAGFEALRADDGRTGLQTVWSEKPEVIVPRFDAPDMDGLDVCRFIRQRSDAFILMLTARAEETDRLIGLEIGADDYITKPFSPREVVARIRSLLRRASGDLVRQDRPISHEGLLLDPPRRAVTAMGW
ncbi:MAG: response regulator transcription factor [Anaerolineales bacterium]|nr:response regulator transcription factor [Anaerolineales bacterium]